MHKTPPMLIMCVERLEIRIPFSWYLLKSKKFAFFYAEQEQQFTISKKINLIQSHYSRDQNQTFHQKKANLTISKDFPFLINDCFLLQLIICLSSIITQFEKPRFRSILNVNKKFDTLNDLLFD